MSLTKHDKEIKKKVFFVDTKWPHFNLLFSDIKKLSVKKKYKNILSLERGGLYGYISLLSPYFKKQNFVSIDCSIEKIKRRGAYNKKFVKSKHIIKDPIDYFFDYRKIKIKKNSKNLIIIPNLLHHIFDHKLLFSQCKNILKKNGQIYIFEPLLRELHQQPNDYFRFTPYGLKQILKDLGFKKISYKLCGGPFSATAYCWDQAIQFLPEKLRKKYKRFLISNNIKDIIKLDMLYKKNLVRKNTAFPVSFSIIASK